MLKNRVMKYVFCAKVNKGLKAVAGAMRPKPFEGRHL